MSNAALGAASQALWTRLLGQLEAHLSVLPDKSEENAGNTLAALWHTSAGRPMSETLAEVTPVGDLDGHAAMVVEGLVDQRIAGVPLAHLTGRKGFSGMELLVNAGRYIPRRETELLSATAREWLTAATPAGTPVIAMDLCTGLGTLALAIAHHLPNATVYGSDLLEESVANAKQNAIHLGLADRVTFVAGDLFHPYAPFGLEGRVDAVVSAPPYISSAKVKHLPAEIATFEPQEAFDAGPFGMSIFNELIATSPTFLRSGGVLALEVGLGQGPFLTTRIMRNPAFASVREVRDEAGNVRVLVATTR
jgi:release factor glutamine methyltransferase